MFGLLFVFVCLFVFMTNFSLGIFLIYCSFIFHLINFFFFWIFTLITFEEHVHCSVSLWNFQTKYFSDSLTFSSAPPPPCTCLHSLWLPFSFHVSCGCRIFNHAGTPEIALLADNAHPWLRCGSVLAWAFTPSGWNSVTPFSTHVLSQTMKVKLVWRWKQPCWKVMPTWMAKWRIRKDLTE